MNLFRICFFIWRIKKLEEILCPACRKTQIGPKQPIQPGQLFQCRRCECDLMPLVCLSAHAQGLYRQGLSYLKNGDPNMASANANASWKVKNTKNAACLAFSAALASHEWDQADEWYRVLDQLETS